MSCPKALLSLLVISFLAPAWAQAARRPETTKLSCQDARALVYHNGAIVMSTYSPNLYERYVDHSQYCPAGQSTTRALVPTLDDPRCFVGYVCRDREETTHIFTPVKPWPAPTPCRNGTSIRVMQGWIFFQQEVTYVCRKHNWYRVKKQ